MACSHHTLGVELHPPPSHRVSSGGSFAFSHYGMELASPGCRAPPHLGCVILVVSMVFTRFPTEQVHVGAIGFIFKFVSDFQVPDFYPLPVSSVS